MSSLLAVKSVSLVRAAVPQGAAAPMPAKEAEAEKPSARSSETQSAASEHAPAKPSDHPAAQATQIAPDNGGQQADAAQADAASRLEPPVSDTERGLLLDLRERRRELDDRDVAMQSREELLSAAEHRLSARIDELTALRTRLEALEAARKERDDANWRSMVKLYESMKPREAAVIFNELDEPVLLQVLDRMKESKAALVMAAMLPDRARRATVDLADMRTKTNAPTSPVPTPKPPDGPLKLKPVGG